MIGGAVGSGEHLVGQSHCTVCETLLGLQDERDEGAVERLEGVVGSGICQHTHIVLMYSALEHMGIAEHVAHAYVLGINGKSTVEDDVGLAGSNASGS